MRRDLPSPLLIDLALRVAGLIALAVALVATTALAHQSRSAAAAPHAALPYLLAALTFLAGSGGMTLLSLGRHVRDRIAVSARWEVRRD